MKAERLQKLDLTTDLSIIIVECVTWELALTIVALHMLLFE